MNRQSNIKKAGAKPYNVTLPTGSRKRPRQVAEQAGLLKTVTSTVHDFAQEAQEAKNYWKSDGVHPAFYAGTPHYVAAIAEVIDAIGADHVFEFGCGSGRNLAALRDIRANRPLQCTGIDISPSLVAVGRNKFNLRIEEGDENALRSIDDGLFDLVFTVSVLDHLPDPSIALGHLARISKGWCLFVEPEDESLPRQSLRLEKVQKTGAQSEAIDPAPYTYLHDYKGLFELQGLEIVLECPLPTHNSRSGLLYRLWLVRKNAEGMSNLSDPPLKRLHDRVLKAALLQLLSNVQEAKELQAKAKTAIADLRARLDAANAKYRAATGSQIPQLKQTIADLKAKLEKANKEQVAAEQKAARFKQEIIHIETQARELTNRLSRMEKSARDSEAKSAALQVKNDKMLQEIRQIRLKNEELQRENRQTAGRNIALRNQLDHAQRQKASAELEAQKTRGTGAYRLGHALIQAGKSWRGFAALPKRLLEISRDERARRLEKRAAGAPHPAPHSGKHAPARTAHEPPPVISSIEGAITPSSLRALKVACIMDEFTHACFADEASFGQLSLTHWRDDLESLQPDMLFVESAWRGKDEQWGNRVGRCTQELLGIIEWCRTRKIPTVFWNKEDPIHFGTFLNTAALFDHVFTTDVDCIGRYKSALGHDRVWLLPFACQPRRFNPLASSERKNAISFAGAYYTRYPNRNRDLEGFIAALSDEYTIDIYDRNYGKDDPNYQFPADYRPFIAGHLPYEDIKKAYQGYIYAINMNSIKQSQSMFARRVFELLGCNTITLSNYSRGLRLFFGDLVLSSDDGAEIRRRLEALGDETTRRKFRLLGLRKVMREHTAEDRLAYVVSRVQGRPPPALMPSILVTAFVKNQQQLDRLYQSYRRQTYPNRRLYAVVPALARLCLPRRDETVHLVKPAEAKGRTLAGIAGKAAYIAGMVAEDYYGPNYLTDLALATRYSDAQAIGKATHYVRRRNGVIALARPGWRYREVKGVAARAALVATASIGDLSVLEWTRSLATRRLDALPSLSVDEFNYCRDGAQATRGQRLREAVNDLSGLDTGLDMRELFTRSEGIAPDDGQSASPPMLSGAGLAALFNTSSAQDFSTSVEGNEWRIESGLPDGKHTYAYTPHEAKPAELGLSDRGELYLETTPGLDVQLALIYLDARKQRLGHEMIASNRNTAYSLPPGTTFVRLGLRLYGGGQASIRRLIKEQRSYTPSVLLGKARHLVLTNLYPQYDSLYRNAFVHSRVAAYARRGVTVDVFRLNADAPSGYHEFQNADVITGPTDALDKLLEAGGYESVAVHFLNKAMWQVLKRHIGRTRVNVWVHGAEIQPFHRREYNMIGLSPDQVKRQKALSEQRLAFWRDLLRKMPRNLHFVFVSKYLAEEVMKDLGFRIPKGCTSIIHNPIDTGLFAYHKKTPEQSRKILSIRPYANRNYANDLSAAAILALKSKPFFKELEFRLVGDGELFDKTTAPLRGLSNVILEKRFLTQAEISALHREYGICLIPTRMDSHGVSRDEAMSSGLVPVTNKVAAIPEFVDKSCARLATPEDAKGLAAAIEELYENPRLFLKLSRAAAERVRRQSGAEKVIAAELKLICGKAARKSAHA